MREHSMRYPEKNCARMRKRAELHASKQATGLTRNRPPGALRSPAAVV